MCQKKKVIFKKEKKSSEGLDSKKYNEYCIPNGKTKRNTDVVFLKNIID